MSALDVRKQLDIHYDAHNYMSFGVDAQSPEDLYALCAMRDAEMARYCAATEEERERVGDAFATSFTLDWHGDTVSMAAAMRHCADWLERVGDRFPGHIIRVDID